MKFFVLFLVLIIGSQAAVVHDETPTEVEEDTSLVTDTDTPKVVDDDDSRISSGADSKRGENLDACWFTANFHTQWIRCSCVVYSANYIITSARCVYE